MASDMRRRRAVVLKAMAHPSRLAILETLAVGEKCVNELQAVVGSDLSTVSRHLSVLRNAGIIADRKQGLQVFYSLRVPCVLSFFGCVDAVLSADQVEAGPVGVCCPPVSVASGVREVER